jgi:hypothetical protein
MLDFHLADIQSLNLLFVRIWVLKCTKQQNSPQITQIAADIKSGTSGLLFDQGLCVSQCKAVYPLNPPLNRGKIRWQMLKIGTRLKLRFPTPSLLVGRVGEGKHFRY